MNLHLLDSTTRRILDLIARDQPHMEALTLAHQIVRDCPRNETGNAKAALEKVLKNLGLRNIEAQAQATERWDGPSAQTLAGVAAFQGLLKALERP